MPLIHIEALKIFALCTAVLAITMALVGYYTGLVRTRLKVTLNQEDAKTFGAQVVTAEPPEVQHIRRCHQNALENVPVFWAVGFTYLLLGAGTTGAAAFFGTFTVSRVLFTVFYLRSMQPWRSASYTVGAVAVIGMCANIVYLALTL